jgi:hypothetical protein
VRGFSFLQLLYMQKFFVTLLRNIYIHQKNTMNGEKLSQINEQPEITPTDKIDTSEIILGILFGSEEDAATASPETAVRALAANYFEKIKVVDQEVSLTFPLPLPPGYEQAQTAVILLDAQRKRVKPKQETLFQDKYVVQKGQEYEVLIAVKNGAQEPIFMSRKITA